MLNFLKNHPFAVEAFFESSTVLTFAVPKQALEKLIPECLSLDTFNDEYAFFAVAIVKTKSLRPKGFPIFMGNDFILVGYRVFVRYIANDGRRLRGLYILKSETDKKKMEFFGNIFTHYNYTTTDITFSKNENITTLQSKKSGFRIDINSNIENISLPLNSPFKDWKEARRFAGPLPFTFTFDAKTKNVLIIEGVREHWQPAPINVVNYHIAFLEDFSKGVLNTPKKETEGVFNTPLLANAFEIRDIPYTWRKGKIEKWNK